VKKIILILSILLATLSFSYAAEVKESNIFRTTVTIRVLCSFGGPGLLIEKLLTNYNEKPVHAMNLSAPGKTNIQMYITENRSNPSSTLLLHNKEVNKTCIFWSAEDYLRTIETESLPAKKPGDDKVT